MISAVVLAAGASTRMGQPKLLLPLAGQPMLRRVVGEVAASGFDEILVILGHEHERMRAALEGLNVRHAVNLDYATGMGSSFRTAIEHLPASEAAMFALADQPFVTSAEFRAVLDAYRETRPAIVCARFGEVTAPPHVFDRSLFEELSQLEHGARPVLQRHRDRSIVLTFSADLLMDVDTPEDYQRANSRASAGR
jgi:molybdenum cofactor cytidylyltransferase